MTTMNSQDDFLRALSENPQWKAAVRAQILGEELLQLPARFDAFVEQMTAFVAEIRGFVAEQKRFNEEITDLVAEQKRIIDRIDRRLTTLSNDVAQAKGGHARSSAIQDAPGIAIDLDAGIRYLRTLTREELAKMAQDAAVGDIPTRELRSFRLADLVIEAKDGNDTCLIAVEASFTASQRDASRARRNAALLTRFTGKPAHAVIASVRNDHDAEAELAAGNVRWHELEERDMEPE